MWMSNDDDAMLIVAMVTSSDQSPHRWQGFSGSICLANLLSKILLECRVWIWRTALLIVLPSGYRS